ncbi:hypothetical protein PSCLAVI8L_160104 [Pseudoclavibacter sp. 8L]|nr:hypothetical protein PSCLAVI8L_160104 [Pseudoclavibacter sp. 8L]
MDHVTRRHPRAPTCRRRAERHRPGRSCRRQGAPLRRRSGHGHRHGHRRDDDGHGPFAVDGRAGRDPHRRDAPRRLRPQRGMRRLLAGARRRRPGDQRRLREPRPHHRRRAHERLHGLDRPHHRHPHGRRCRRGCARAQRDSRRRPRRMGFAAGARQPRAHPAAVRPLRAGGPQRLPLGHHAGAARRDRCAREGRSASGRARRVRPAPGEPAHHRRPRQTARPRRRRGRSRRRLLGKHFSRLHPHRARQAGRGWRRGARWTRPAARLRRRILLLGSGHRVPRGPQPRVDATSVPRARPALRSSAHARLLAPRDPVSGWKSNFEPGRFPERSDLPSPKSWRGRSGSRMPAQTPYAPRCPRQIPSRDGKVTSYREDSPNEVTYPARSTGGEAGELRRGAREGPSCGR